MVRQNNVFSTGGGQPYDSLPELISAARDNPGTVTFGHGGQGSPQHFTVEMAAAETGVFILILPDATILHFFGVLNTLVYCCRSWRTSA